MTTETVWLLVLLGAINHQVSHIITVGVIFEDMRQWVTRCFGEGSKMAYLVRCHLCAGSWVGFVLALVVASEIRLTALDSANVVLLSLVIALLGRVWNEALAYASCKVGACRTSSAA